MKKNYDLIIKNVEIIDKGFGNTFNIGIEGNKIAYVGEQRINGEIEIDGARCVAVPGFVNAHTHIAMTLLRSYGDDMQLMDWLFNKIFPAEENFNREGAKWGTQLGIAEMLRSGTTAFADMYFEMDVTAEQVATTGIRANLCRGLSYDDNWKNKIKENARLFKDWHGKENGRIRVMFGPHAPYTCPIPFLKEIRKAAAKVGAELHMHLQETKGEVDNYVAEHGVSPIVMMDKLGLFDGGMLAAHCVAVDEKDLEILAAKKVRVAHNPQSNLKLASGVAPTADFLKKKICVALGTDGCASNNNLDMLEEARLAAFLSKGVNGNPTNLPAKTALAMATVNGAKALGFENLGLIKKGQLADIVLWNTDKPHWYPHHNLLANLIYAANSADVETVIVDGKVLMYKNELLTIDEEKVMFEANRCAKKMVGGK